MIVVCKGYKTCVDKKTCIHSKPHEYRYNEYVYNNGVICDTNNCIVKNNVTPNCHCESIFLRKEKLEKLGNVSNL